MIINPLPRGWVTEEYCFSESEANVAVAIFIEAGRHLGVLFSILSVNRDTYSFNIYTHRGGPARAAILLDASGGGT